MRARTVQFKFITVADFDGDSTALSNIVFFNDRHSAPSCFTGTARRFCIMKLNRRNTLKSKLIRSKTLNTLSRAAFVESLEPRQLLAAWSPQDQIIGLDKAVQNYPGVTGSGETVVLIDQGVDYNHPALGGGYGNKVVTSWNFGTNSYDVFPYDGNAHGTGSAGQVAGDARVVNGLTYQGVAPGVKLIALSASGTYQVKQAFDWVVAHRAQYNIVGVNWVDPTGGSDSNQFQSALYNLKSQGVFVGGPTGNYGPGPVYAVPNNSYFQFASSTLYNSISTFSPRGSGVNLVAPGDNIDVTWYYSGIHADLPSSGTSWASPQVVGAAALIHQINPGLTPDQEMQILQQSATQIYDSYSGTYYGQLNVNGAIELAYQKSGQSAYTAPTPVAAPAPAPVAAAAVAGTGSQPFKGTPFSTGSVIQAGYYDLGGEGVAFHKTTNFNESGNNSFRGDSVGITWTNAGGGSSTEGWTHASEWLNYTINAAASGSYAIKVNVADAVNGGTFHVEVDGKDATGSLTVPNTGGWDNYSPVSKGGVWIPAGQHVVRIVMDTNGGWGYVGNFMNVSVNPDGGAVAPAVAYTAVAAYTAPAGSAPESPFALSAFAASRSRNVLAFYDNSTNESGFVIERAAWNSGVFNIVTTVASDAGTSTGKGWRFFTDSGNSGTYYNYRIRAINQAGSSGYTTANVSTT